MRSNRPYVQLDPAVIEQARQMDLLSYLQRYEPDNLKHVARKPDTGLSMRTELCFMRSRTQNNLCLASYIDRNRMSNLDWRAFK